MIELSRLLETCSFTEFWVRVGMVVANFLGSVVQAALSLPCLVVLRLRHCSSLQDALKAKPALNQGEVKMEDDEGNVSFAKVDIGFVDRIRDCWFWDVGGGSFF